MKPERPRQWSLSEEILVLGKAKSCRAPNLGCRGLSHLGDLMFHQKVSAQDVVHEQVRCHDETAGLQLPIALAL